MFCLDHDWNVCSFSLISYHLKGYTYLSDLELDYFKDFIGVVQFVFYYLYCSLKSA